jgi:hypothetical protein
MTAARRRRRWVIAIEAIVAAVMTAVGTWWLPLVSAGIALGFLGGAIFAVGAVAIRLGRHPRILIPPPLR